MANTSPNPPTPVYAVTGTVTELLLCVNSVGVLSNLGTLVIVQAGNAPFAALVKALKAYDSLNSGFAACAPPIPLPVTAVYASTTSHEWWWLHLPVWQCGVEPLVIEAIDALQPKSAST